MIVAALGRPIDAGLVSNGGGMSATGGLGERRYDLDWVRIGAFLLLILYHIGMYYVTWDWHVKSPHASSAIEPLMLLTSPWRLSLLFLVSGVATGYLLERQGARGFLGRRSVRLLVPLVFGMLVIVPPQSYLEVVEKVQYAGNYGEFLGLYLDRVSGILSRRRLPDPADLESPLVRRLSLGVHADRVRGRASRARSRAAGAPVARATIRRVRRAARADRLSRRRTHAARSALPFDARARRRLVQPRRLRARCSCSASRWPARAHRGTAVERLRWHALGFAVLGWVFLCVWHGLDNSDSLFRRSAAACLAARVQRADMARNRGRSRVRAPPLEP